MANRRTPLFPTPRRLAAVVGALMAVALAARLLAAVQDRPNFTGDWTLDLKNSQLHEDYRALEKGVIRIDHHEPAFAFRRTYFVKGQPYDASFQATTDGREHRGVSPNGSASVSTMRWENAELVIQQRISDPKAGELENRVRYELLDGGRTLRATEDFSGGGRSHHNIWIFTRQ